MREREFTVRNIFFSLYQSYNCEDIFFLNKIFLSRTWYQSVVPIRKRSLLSPSPVLFALANHDASENAKEDPLSLQNSDHPGINLISFVLIGNNYMTWSRSIKIALGSKTKLGFIDGRCKQPAENESKYEQRLKVDCMVRSWILNSIAKDIVEDFLYVNTAKELWDELKERYGECNGPLLYHIQREISTITQGRMTVAQYYTKLKKSWDELNCLTPIPDCSCGAAKTITDVFDSSRLIQFLMGLNDAYNAIRRQILLLEPLPYPIRLTWFCVWKNKGR